eukprot:SAG25_NODE_2057_length_1993_cov_3.897043_1_plen_63_part_10
MAQLFASRHGLDRKTTGELALAIVEHAKHLGFVRPLFVMQVCRRHRPPPPPPPSPPPPPAATR